MDTTSDLAVAEVPETCLDRDHASGRRFVTACLAGPKTAATTSSALPCWTEVDHQCYEDTSASVAKIVTMTGGDNLLQRARGDLGGGEGGTRVSGLVDASDDELV